MSSKSRKHSPPKGGPRKAAETLEPGDPAHGVPQASDFEVPDELIHVPDETSKLRFVLMVLLVIVLLVIFVVPSALMGVTGGNPDAGETFVSWKLPDGERVALDQRTFMLEKRAIDSAFAVHPLLRSRMGVEDRSPDDEETARILILDRLAQDSGVAVTDAELATELRDSFDLYSNIPQFGGPANQAEYQALVNRYGGAAAIEGSLRRCMRVERMTSLLGSLAAQADPARIEELWGEQHVEQRFQYVAASTEAMTEQARAELPADAELEAWLAELPEAEKKPYELPEKRGLTVALYEGPESTPATGLLEAYPEAEEVDATERAQAYYDRSFFLRFRRPEPAEGEEIDPANPPTPYLSFEEVKERCLAEAPVFFALQRWNEELSSKTLAGEEIDLEAEARRLGLEARTVDPVTRAELNELETVGGIATAAVGFQTNQGRFFANVNVLEDALTVVRVDVVEPASMPPFAEIREAVADTWVERRAAELVDERLASMRASFESFTPEVEEGQIPRAGDLRKASAEAFRAAAEAAGLEVQEYGWRDKGARMLADWEDSDTDLARFVWRNRQLRQFELGEVSAPLADAALGQTFLLRLAEERPRSLDAMGPGDFEQYVAASQREVRANLVTGFDEDYLVKHFGLEFFRKEVAEDEEEGA